MPAVRNATRMAAALLLIGCTAPAFAGPPDWAPAHGNRHKFHAPRIVRVVPAPYVTYAARPVVVYRAPVAAYRAPVATYRTPVVYAAPPPVYYHPARPYYGVPGALAGAVAGAVIGGALGHGDQRVAAVAVGSVVGAVIGHEISGGR